MRTFWKTDFTDVGEYRTRPQRASIQFRPIAQKTPQGEKKICEKIVAGTATDAEVKTTLDAYKAMADSKPPRGDQEAFKEKVAKLTTATEEVAANNHGAADIYKAAVNCKACHTDFKPEDKK